MADKYGNEDTRNQKRGSSGGYAAERYPGHPTKKQPSIGKPDSGGFHKSTERYVDKDNVAVKPHRPSRLSDDA